MSYQTISAAGLGYIGLPTAAVFASHKVIGVDVKQKAVDTISWGQIHVVEPDLSFPQTRGEASDIRIAHCPERVLPGQVLRELVQNDRVIGGMTLKCSEAAARLYKTFVEGECVITNARTAEMCKLTENSFRDVNIAFANELSIICDKLGGIDVWELIRLANRHPRVNILQPGPGVGGHCIAVDPWFIVSKTPEQARVIRTAREVNDDKPAWVIAKVKLAVQKAKENGVNEPVIACYGLAFKPNIDDLRESPAVHIVQNLQQTYKNLIAVEPHIEALPASLNRAMLLSMDKAMEYADIHVLLVDHKQFMSHPPSRGKIVDARGIWTK